MKVFYDGDSISFDGDVFYIVTQSDSESLEFQYTDTNGKPKWAQVWQVKEVKTKEP